MCSLMAPCDVLIVEDDFANKYLCEQILREAGFMVTSVAGYAAAREAVRRCQFRVMLLDLGLPDGEGLDLLAELRQNQSAIIMTGRCEPEQRALGLRAGAVDYLVKPFHPDELVLRVKRAVSAMTAGIGHTSAKHLHWGDFILDKERRAFTAADGTSVALTAGETEVLARLLRRPAVVPTEVLADLVGNGVGSTRTVSVLISRLRRKFRCEASFDGIVIRVVRGCGYYIESRRR